MNIQIAIEKIIGGVHLKFEEMQSVMHQIMSGDCTSSQIAGFLVALRMKGESVDEVSGAATVMTQLADTVDYQSEHLIDIVGTGGDGANTFNISSAASFVAVAAGAQVAKHGNRSVSSRSGSADYLEKIGAKIDLNTHQVAQVIEKTGIGFMFAPLHHSATKYAVAPRKELGVRTLFNILGPLTNPAQVKRQVIGVYAKEWVALVAQVCAELGKQHVIVVHSEDGLDEISVGAPTNVCELKNEEIYHYTISPEQFGIKQSRLSSIVVNSADQSKAMIDTVFCGEKSVARDIVVLNAAAGIYVSGLCDSIEQGVDMAAHAIDSGGAQKAQQKYIKATLAYR